MLPTATQFRSNAVARPLPALTAACAVVLALVAGPSCAVEDCHGRADALGTSRIIVVDPAEHPRIGSQQYIESLPLRDHEIVLTFDDGPNPKNSNKVLDTLAQQCVLATFFTVGEMAKDHPEGVRRLVAEGHTIGTHSEKHPLNMNRLSEERIAREINEGIAHTIEAAGSAEAVAPFFRIPGLAKGPAPEKYLQDHGLMTWSIDFNANDWHSISSDRVAMLAIKRIEERKRGILLLHDIHERTANALPVILRELKSRGYSIVHVVPTGPGRPATPSEPHEWRWSPETSQTSAAAPAPFQPTPSATEPASQASGPASRQRSEIPAVYSVPYGLN